MPTAQCRRDFLMSDAQSLTPREAGFYLPAEWAPHAATWFAWPPLQRDLARTFREAENTIARCVSHLARATESISERVEILVQKPSDADRIKKILAFWDTNMDRVHFHPFPTNDVWIRDYGPTFLVRDDNANDGLGTPRPGRLAFRWLGRKRSDLLRFPRWTRQPNPQTNCSNPGHPQLRSTIGIGRRRL